MIPIVACLSDHLSVLLVPSLLLCICLQPSIYLPSGICRRACSQLLLAGDVDGDVDVVVDAGSFLLALKCDKIREMKCSS